MAARKLFAIIAASIVLTVGLSTLSAWGVASLVVATAATSSVSGVHGAAGTNGANGKDGATGTPGANGDIGSNGSVGANGATGPTGGVGASGASGLPGPQGIAAAMGPVGPAGPTGASGASAPSFSFVSSGSSTVSPPNIPFPVGSLVAQVPAGTTLVGFSVALHTNAPPEVYYCQLLDDLGGVLSTSATLDVGGPTSVVFTTTQVVSLPTATHLNLQCVTPQGMFMPIDYLAVSIYAISFA
jgi:hypothetical protein